MGLLDDAIKEHLDLKRRHGAAEDEVRRLEQEALGPPRRGEVPEPLAPPAPVSEAEPDEVELEAADEPPPPPPPPAAAVAPAPEADPAPAPPPPAEDLYEDEPWADEPPPPSPPLPPAPAAEAGEEDVLEETPDFLQETPEHDRLWFEQKPPKDFDFDK